MRTPMTEKKGESEIRISIMLNKSKNKAEKPKTRKAKGRTVGCKQLRIKKYITIKVITIL